MRIGRLCALGVLAVMATGVLRVRAQTDAAKQTFTNPVLWEDLADLEVVRVGGHYFYSASNMQYSPGAPILESEDLMHWRYVGHAIPRLDFSPAYDLQGGRAYVKGSWASFFGYRPSDTHFYWGGCIEFKKTHIFSAPAAAGPWQRLTVLDKCYYDAGLLVDDDDTMYVAYGAGTIHVAQLSKDAKQEVRNEEVFTSPKSVGYIEGSRFYKRNGVYYIFVTHPASEEYVLRSTKGPFGPYEMHPFVSHAQSPIAQGGSPHQGGIVQTAGGEWFYMAFTDAFPGGRMPVLAPVRWSDDGWPSVEVPGNVWQVHYPTPDGLPAAPGPDPHVYRELFRTSVLSPEWEWNHNPDNAMWRAGKGLTLKAATVTDDLYSARNTLTHRIRGPQSTATVRLDAAQMKDGDCAGLAVFRDLSAWIGVEKDSGKLRVSMHDHIDLDRKWQTVNKGVEEASAALPGKAVWLRAAADIRPGEGRTAQFSWSTDGKTFQPLGPPFVLTTDWHFFMGYRFGLFNYATRALGGSVHIAEFSTSTPALAAN